MIKIWVKCCYMYKSTKKLFKVTCVHNDLQFTVTVTYKMSPISLERWSMLAVRSWGTVRSPPAVSSRAWAYRL